MRATKCCTDWNLLIGPPNASRCPCVGHHLIQRGLGPSQAQRRGTDPLVIEHVDQVVEATAHLTDDPACANTHALVANDIGVLTATDLDRVDRYPGRVGVHQEKRHAVGFGSCTERACSGRHHQVMGRPCRRRENLAAVDHPTVTVRRGRCSHGPQHIGAPTGFGEREREVTPAGDQLRKTSSSFLGNRRSSSKWPPKHMGGNNGPIASPAADAASTTRVESRTSPPPPPYSGSIPTPSQPAAANLCQMSSRCSPALAHAPTTSGGYSRDKPTDRILQHSLLVTQHEIHHDS